MKRWIITFVALLLLSGCTEKVDNNEILHDYDLDAKYNVLQNNYENKITMYDLEDSVITYPIVKGQTDDYYFPCYINDGELHYLMEDISSVCSFDNPDACDGLIKAPWNKIFYYKNKIYYFDQKQDSKKNQVKTVVMSANIDSSKHKEIFKNTLEEKWETNTNYVPSYMQFHRNKIYLNHNNTFYIGDVDKNELEKVVIEGVNIVEKVFLFDDTMYVFTEEYDDGKKLHFNVTLECDLLGNVKKLLYEDMLTIFVDHDNVFYREENESNEYEWFILNRTTNEKKSLNNSSYYYLLKYNDMYLLDTDNYDGKNSEFVVLDKNGNVLGEKDYSEDENHYSHLLVDNKFYVYSSLHDCYGFYEISREGISDLKLIETKSE